MKSSKFCECRGPNYPVDIFEGIVWREKRKSFRVDISMAVLLAVEGLREKMGVCPWFLLMGTLGVPSLEFPSISHLDRHILNNVFFYGN